ncbi:MAG: helix-turn-helix transcriptional regulator [Planctomycetota bacterium]|jgi:excisionase family DNA binding protein
MQLMSIEDLAAYLGDSKRTIYKYIASGDCPPYMKISSKNIKFDRADVDAWLESKKVFPGPGGKKMSESGIVEKSKLPWTPRAKAVLKHAQKQARRDGYDLIGSDHILFGILSVKDCLGATILRNLGVDLAGCRELCDSPGNHGAGKAAPGEQVNEIIRCAHEQATAWSHEYIGAEHLLAGILMAGKGAGYRILTDLGVTLEQVRKETTELVVCRDSQEERNTK